MADKINLPKGKQVRNIQVKIADDGSFIVSCYEYMDKPTKSGSWDIDHSETYPATAEGERAALECVAHIHHHNLSLEAKDKGMKLPNAYEHGKRRKMTLDNY